MAPSLPAKYKTADKMDFEAPLTTLIWLGSLLSIARNLWD